MTSTYLGFAKSGWLRSQFCKSAVRSCPPSQNHYDMMSPPALTRLQDGRPASVFLFSRVTRAFAHLDQPRVVLCRYRCANSDGGRESPPCPLELRIQCRLPQDESMGVDAQGRYPSAVYTPTSQTDQALLRPQDTRVLRVCLFLPLWIGDRDIPEHSI